MIKPKEKVIEQIAAVDWFCGKRPQTPWGPGALDRRDRDRIVAFLTYDEALAVFSEKELVPRKEWGDVTAWTRDEILSEMKEDLDFAIEKAEDERWLSLSMFSLMRFWLWLLNDHDLLDTIEYTNFGMPAFRIIKRAYFPDARSNP